MTRPIALVGAGEHAKVVLDAIRSRAEAIVAGVVAPGRAEAERLGVPWLGEDATFLAGDRDADVVIAVGGPPAVREQIANRYETAHARFATVVHARAIVSPSAAVEQGAVVLAGAIVNAAARVGPHAIVNTGSIVEHDCVLGPFAHAAPGTVMGGGVNIGARAHLGLGCRIRDHVKVGSDATVGMGAAVVGDVADGVTVVGVPARLLRKAVE